VSKPQHEVADIIHLHGKAYEKTYTPAIQVSKVLRVLSLCRTQALGGHVEVCKSCGSERISYNSCRNRHCPKCQCTNREKWILARESELLPVPYYHIVFTLPPCFNELLPKYAKDVYNSLFEASWQTLQTFATDHKYLGAKSGMVAVLHTWGQQLWLHPHLHCIVPGGGITSAGKWKTSRSNGKYLFPKKAMSSIFRARFMAALRKKTEVPQQVAKQTFQKKWVVYAKRPFASPKTVVEYLGRYTHKVAISNHRLLDVNAQTVTFSYKDYRVADKKKTLTISGTEFLRRFAHHVLPCGFVRIRHYGFLASRNKPTELNAAKLSLGQQKWEKQNYAWQQIATEKLGYDPGQCPHCMANEMIIIQIINPERGPPKSSIL
jgi:hypothetical protein